MLRRTITLLLLACLTLAFVGRISADGPGHDQIIAALNAQRSATALPALTPDPALASAAQLQANHMAATASVTHYGAAGGSVATRAQTIGYAGEVNEVIFGGVADPAGIVKWWMNSDTHWPTILNGAFTQVGVATATNAETGWTYWCVVFGAPTAQRSADVNFVSVARVDAAATQPEPESFTLPAAPAPTAANTNTAPPPPAAVAPVAANTAAPVDAAPVANADTAPAPTNAAVAPAPNPEPIVIAAVAPIAQPPAVVALGGVGGLPDTAPQRVNVVAPTEDSAETAEQHQQASMSFDPVHIAIAVVALFAAGVFILLGYLKPRRSYDPFRRHY